MKSFQWAAITGGLALAAFQIFGSPVQAQTFATTTLQGTATAGYTIKYTISTKNHTKLPTPAPAIDVQYSANGGPFTDYINSGSSGTFKVAPNGKSCSFTSYFQFSAGVTSINLEFISTDTNLTLKKVSEKPNPLNVPIVRLNATGAGRYAVSLVLSGIYDGPPIPSPIPTFTVTASGEGMAASSVPVQVVPTSGGQELQLTFDLNAKKPGPMQVTVKSPFRYLTLVSDDCYSTNSLGKVVKLGKHNNF